MISLDERREIVDRFRLLEERSAQRPSLVVHGTVLSSEGALAAFLRSAADGAPAEIEQQLAALEAEQQRREESRVPERPAPDPDAPLDPMERVNAEMFAEAQRAAEFRATDGGRLERLIEINEQILAALEKRA